MKKWISPATAKSFAFGTAIYLCVLGLNYLSPAREDSVFGRLFYILLPFAPLAILADTARNIYRDRRRWIEDQRKEEKGDASDP